MKVVSLWRYPVKSMMGEELNACEITIKGLLGRTLAKYNKGNFGVYAEVLEKRV